MNETGYDDISNEGLSFIPNPVLGLKDGDSYFRFYLNVIFSECPVLPVLAGFPLLFSLMALCGFALIELCN